MNRSIGGAIYPILQVGVLISASVVLVGLAYRPVAQPAVLADGARSPIDVPAYVTRDTLNTSTEAINGRNPFRTNGLPSAVAFDPLGQYVPPPAPPPAPPKPRLVLKGLVLGATPSAVIEGLPGTSGSTLLRLEEEAGGVVFEALRADSAVFVGYDTLWVLAPEGR